MTNLSSRDRGIAASIATIVIGVFILVGFVFAFVVFTKYPAPQRSAMDLHAAWYAVVAREVTPLVAGSDTPSVDRARQTKTTLLTLTIAPQDRDAHLALVLALLAIENGEPTARQKLQDAIDSVTP